MFRGVSRWFNAEPVTIEVQGTERFRDRDYSRVSFLGRTIYLRATDAGIVSFNAASGEENPWLPFDGAVGVSRPVDIEPCTKAAKVESRDAKVTTPSGEWGNALQFSFEQSCADAGITTMYFVPDVGPVAYETTTIAGPVRWELIYARSGSTVAEAPHLGFTVALDSPVYKKPDATSMLVRLTLRNTSPAPVTLVFTSSQSYDLRIWNDKGESVYVWSADKSFAQVLRREPLSGGERTFAFTVPVNALPVGRYVAEAWLATQAREYVGIVGFEVTQ